jgi:hypothetical protein
MSTSIAYLSKRLRDIGRLDLLEGAERGEFSYHAAAIWAGLIKQREALGNGSPNKGKRAAWAIWKATRQSPTSAQPEPTPAKTVANGHSLPRPDLAAALAEWEAAQRDEEPEPTPPPLAPDPERTPIPTHPAIPCTSCTHPNAPLALREVFNTYVAARRGEPFETGSTLPRTCCQRQLRIVDARCLIG